jgi:two-component system, OmpR family, response regulator
MMSMAGDGSGRARLLVVDDEETILELLSGSLRLAGFEVVTAASGTQALRAVAASKPDLVLLDVMMPDGDGFEVVRRIRSSGPDVPVIFLSARDGVRERVAGLALGGDDYITKPFSLDEVLERIRAVLRRTGRAVPATRLRVADLELDEDSHEVRRGGSLIALTPTEFRLLRFLMLNAGPAHEGITAANPVNGLDPEGVVWIRTLLTGLAAEGRTVFVSSHLMSEMAQTATSLIIVGPGKPRPPPRRPRAASSRIRTARCRKSGPPVRGAGTG